MSSSMSFFAALSAFLVPGIPVWVGIQLLVDFCINLDATSLMGLAVF